MLGTRIFPAVANDDRVVTNGTGGGSGDLAETFTASAGTLLVAIVRADCQGGDLVGAIPTPTTSGLTWTLVGSITPNEDFVASAAVFIADNASAGTKTFTMAGAGNWVVWVNSVDLTILEFSGAQAVASQTKTPISAQNESLSGRDPGAQSVTLPVAPAASSYAVATYAADTDGTVTVIAGTGWTETSQNTSDGTANWLLSQVQMRTGSTSATVLWDDLASSTNVYNYVLFAWEVLATSGAYDETGRVISITATVVSTDSGAPIVYDETGRTVSITATVTSTDSGSGFVASFPIPTSLSGRKILDQDGNVYLARTFSSWSMASHLTNAEITQALEDVATNHFNGVTVWMGGVEDRGGTGWAGNMYKNAAGQDFWSGTAWASALGPAWTSVDHLISEAFDLGVTVHFSFCAGFSGFGPEDDWVAATNANMHQVGVDIATRYADYPNIVWHIMFDGDSTPADTVGVRIDNLFDGINDTEGISTRPVRWLEVEEGSSMFNNGWYDPTGAADPPRRAGATFFRGSINCGYSYSNAATEAVESWYGETSGPTGDCEPRYVGAASELRARHRMYSVFIEGGCLINYGHEGWWPFGADPLYPTGLDWTDIVTEASSLQARYCWDFIDAHLADTTFAPTSAFVTTGEDTGENKAAQGLSTGAASKAVAYFPYSTTVQVDTTILTGTGNVRLRWYNPYDGTYTTIAASEAQQTGRAVSYPGFHADTTSDYALVVDLIPAAANYDETGRSVLVTATITSTDSFTGITAYDETGRSVLVTATIISTDVGTTTLVVANATHLQTAGAPTFGLLSVDSAGHVQAVESITITVVEDIVVLNDALAVRLGDQEVSAVYVGSIKVWP